MAAPSVLFLFFDALVESRVLGSLPDGEVARFLPLRSTGAISDSDRTLRLSVSVSDNTQVTLERMECCKVRLASSDAIEKGRKGLEVMDPL